MYPDEIYYDDDDLDFPSDFFWYGDDEEYDLLDPYDMEYDVP